MPVYRLVEVLMDKTCPGWRERQARRKSLWHLPTTIVMFALLGGLWFVLFRAMWQVHLVWHPEHAGHLQEFWSEGIRLQPFVASALLALPLFLPAVGVSLILTNLLFWFIRLARRVFEREADGDPEMKFRGATGKLLKVTLLIFVPLGIGPSLVGAWLLVDLR
jgi:H+/Cl- antiporter ClcA